MRGTPKCGSCRKVRQFVQNFGSDSPKFPKMRNLFVATGIKTVINKAIPCKAALESNFFKKMQNFVKNTKNRKKINIP